MCSSHASYEWRISTEFEWRNSCIPCVTSPHFPIKAQQFQEILLMIASAPAGNRTKHPQMQVCTLVNVPRRDVWRMPSSGIWRGLSLVSTDLLRARAKSYGIFRGQSKAGTGFVLELLFPLPFIHSFIPLIAPQSSPPIIQGWQNR
jgi:hypothetical protein